MFPVDTNGKPVAERRTQKFVYDDEEPPAAQVADIGYTKGRADVSSIIVPLGNIADADAIHKRSSKPAMKDPKSKWSGKGEQLSTEAAIQFMIKERAMMDLETAQLRRDNEKLRRSLEQKMAQNDRSSHVIPVSVSVKAGLSPKSNNEDSYPSTTDSDSALREQLALLKADNERLKLQHLTQGKDGRSSPIPAPPSSMALAQAAGAALSPPPPVAARRDSRTAASKEEVFVISSILWDGGYLWKIPYNGKGAPERRIIALKRATVYPSPGSRAVRVDRGGSLSPPENYISFPPTLMWYNSDKPGQIKNARELILYEGTCLMEGHNTNAFYKLATSDRPVPKPELCFSMMTSTRSLDLAAETTDSAMLWKDAMHALLVEFSPNKAWAAVNLRRNKPFWDQKVLEDIPSPTSAGNRLPLPKAPQSSQSQSDGASKRAAREKKKDKEEEVSGSASPRGKPMKKELIKKQLFAASRAKDHKVLEQLFQAGVPANLQDETAENDTPLMIACRLNDADSARVCLQYGAKNDPHPDFGDTALHLATDFGNYDVAAIILSAAAQSEADHMIANLTNEEKKTPLHVAAFRGYLELIELLLHHGATIETKDELDQTALHVCSAAGHRECLAALLDQGGDHLLEYPDLGGNTALHHAAQGGHWHCIKLLLETAADCMVRNARGQTAYKLSVDQGHQQIAKLLLEYTKDYQNASNKGYKRAAADVVSASSRSPLRNSIDNSMLVVSNRTPNASKPSNSLRLSVDELAFNYGVEPEETAEVSLNVNAHLPPSPKHTYGTPMGKLAMGSSSPYGTPSAATLPRPHSGGSSPAIQAGKRLQPQPTQGQGAYVTGQYSPVTTQGQGAYVTGQYSPVTLGGSVAGAGGYALPVGGRSRAASDGMYGSPAQHGYDPAYDYDPSQQPQQDQYVAVYNAAGGEHGYNQHQQHSYDAPGTSYGYFPGSARVSHAPHVDAYANSPHSARERPTPSMLDGMNVHYGYDQSHEQLNQHQEVPQMHSGMSPIQSWNGPHGQHMQHAAGYAPQLHNQQPAYEQYNQAGQYAQVGQYYDQATHDTGSYGTSYAYDANDAYAAPTMHIGTQHHAHHVHAPPALQRAYSEPQNHAPAPVAKGPKFYSVDPTASVAMEPVESALAGYGQESSAIAIAIGSDLDQGNRHEHAIYLGEGSAYHEDTSHSRSQDKARSSREAGSVGLWIDPSHEGGQDDQQHQQEYSNGDNFEEAAGTEAALEEFEACDRYWAVYQTDDGHVYYLDAAAEHSQWDDPRTYGLVFEAYEEEGTAYDEELLTHDPQQATGGRASDQAQLQPSNSDAQYTHSYRSSPSPKAKASPPKSPSPKAANGRRSPSFQSDFSGRHSNSNGNGNDNGNANNIPRLPENENSAAASSAAAHEPKGLDRAGPRVQKALFGRDEEGAAKEPRNRSQTQKLQTTQRRYDISDDSASSEDEGKDSSSGGARVRVGAVSRAKGRSVARTHEPLRKSSSDAISSSSASGPNEEAYDRKDRRERDPAVSQSVDAGSAAAAAVSGPKSVGGIAAKVEAIARRRASQREASLERNAAAAADSKNGEVAVMNASGVPPGSDGSFKAATKDGFDNRHNEGKDESIPVLFASSAKDSAPELLSLLHPPTRASSAETKDAKGHVSPIQISSAAESKSEAVILSKEERVEQYMQKLRNGEPLRVVRRAMEDADEDKMLIKEIMAFADTVSPVPKAKERPAETAAPGANTNTNLTASDSAGYTENAAPVEKITDLRGDGTVGKYAKMASMGVPHGSVLAKMKVDGIEVGQMNRILGALGLELEVDPNAAGSAAGSGAAVVAKEDLAVLKADSVVGKYAKMASMGVPHGSVLAKMKVDGIATSQINRILVSLGMEPEVDSVNAENHPVLAAARPKIEKEDMSVLKADPTVGKYAKMASMGVPPSSVAAKMKSDGVAVDQRNRVLVALGIEPEEEAAAARAGPGAGVTLRAALAAGPGRGMQRRPSVKMQSLHWDTISQDKMDKSIWAQAVDGDEQEHVNDADVREIEKLFALTVDSKKEAVVTDVKKAADPATILRQIDGKRAQNVTIGIQQYKNVAADHYTLLRAVCSLDKLHDRLKLDHLENLGALLPTPQEVKAVTLLSSSAHPAEMFLATACKFYPDLPKRLECYLHVRQLADNCEVGLGKAAKLVDACNEIISNDKLQRVLQKMLAVGNVMNQGTYRGNATGFTVDSLLRMINMKGADKKTTVLDYVVKSLYDRGEERVLVVAEDLAVLEGASKISGTEIGKQLAEIDSAYESMKEELHKVQGQLQAGAGVRSPQPSGAAPPPGVANMSELFASRLEKYVSEQLPRVEEVRRVRRLMLRKVTEVVEYFGEDTTNCDTVSIFGVLQEFRHALTNSKNALIRRERSLAKQAKSEGRMSV